MFGSYSDTGHNYSKWFYAKKGTEDNAELSRWKCEIVMIPTNAPNRPTLLTNFAAFVAKRKLCALLKSDYYGCQYDKPSKKDHTCLEPWEDSVEEHFDKVKATHQEFKEDYRKVLDILELLYHAYEGDVKDENVKALVTQNVILDDFVTLFTEVMDIKK